MGKVISIIAASLIGGLLGGCASSADRPASCHGALRAANPHGSVLQADLPAAAASENPPALGSPASSSEAGSRSDRGREPGPCGGAPS